MTNPITLHELRDSRGIHFTQIDDLFIDDGHMKAMSPAATVAYLFLCRRGNRNGSSFPGAEDWERYTGLHRNTVREAIAQLLERGLVSVEHRPGSSNVYTLHKISANSEQTPAQIMCDYPHKKCATPSTKNVHEVDTSKNTQTSNDAARRNSTRSAQNFSIHDVGTDQERSDRWDAKIELFDAYCRGAGIRAGSAEMERKRSFAYADLDAVYLLITPAKLEAMAARLAAIYREKGITKTPDIGRVLESESEFDRETAPAPVIPKPAPRFSKLTPEQMARRNELREKIKAEMHGGDELTESEEGEFSSLLELERAAR